MASRYASLVQAQVKDEELLQLVNKLKDFGPKLAKRELKKAVNAGAQVVLKEARKRVPWGAGLTPKGEERKHLRELLAKRVRQYKRAAIGIVGTPYKQAPHDHLVHDGTKPHVIFLPWDKAFRLGPLIIRGPMPIQHPGTKPTPFLSDAMDAKRDEVFRKMKDKLAKSINKLASEST